MTSPGERDPNSVASGNDSHSISRQLATGFGLVAVVAVLMCLVLTMQLARAGAAVMTMRDDEAAMRLSGSLAISIREQYIHVAHGIIEGDSSHLEHQREWGARVAAAVAELREMVPEEDQWRLDEIAETSEQLRASLLEGGATPVRDFASVRDVHRALESGVQRASEHADAVAQHVTGRMVDAHVVANRATRVGFAAGAFCVALVLGLSSFFTIRLRRSVLRPLAELADAARRVGSGRFDVRIGEIGTGELRAVAAAFDRMAMELAERESRLMKTERMAAIGQLAAGVAHELNNPIGIIRGYLKMIDLDGDPDTLRSELAILDEEALACQRIVNDLRTYATRPHLEPAETRMHELLVDVTARLRDTGLVGTGHEVTVRAEPGSADVDAARVRQVLSNLIVNAAQASGEAGEIEVTGHRVDDAYVVTVGDRGPGIAEADKARIFEPFFSKRGGSGLGLAICHGLVAAHAGRIRLWDRAGGGTVFEVTLPLRPPVQADTGSVETAEGLP